MTRPTDYPDFSLTGSKTAPSPGLTNTGWLAGMKLPAQILNYLLNLNGLWHRSHVIDLDARAVKQGGNAWTGNQQWQASTTAGEFLNTLVASVSDPLQLVFKFQTSSNADEIGVWTGNNTQGNLFITYNATWNGSEWSQLDSSRESAALYLDTNRWRLGRRSVASGTWATWQADGDMSVGTLGALALACVGLTSDGSQTVYDPAISATETWPISAMVGLNGEPDSVYPGAIAPSSSPSSVWLSIWFPSGCTAGNLRFYHHRQADSYDTVFKLYQRNLAFADGGAVPSLTAVSGATYTEATGAGTGSFEGGFDLSGAGLDPEKEYLIEWANGNTGDRLYGIKMVGTNQIAPRAGAR